MEQVLYAAIVIVVMLLVWLSVRIVMLRLSIATPGSSAGTGLLRSATREMQSTIDMWEREEAEQIQEEDQAALELNEEERREQNALTLENRLKHAGLSNVPAYIFSVLQIVISLLAFSLARAYLEIPLQLVALTLGPLSVNGFIQYKMRKRTDAFDKDFPPFLLNAVSMLKTGMNSVQALQAAAEGLDRTSAVRREVELMLKRLRVGVPEDKSIGSFGETIHHPEVDLFVQAVILSRRLGGVLSDTLQRLSKQARNRQKFRRSASTAVSQQRASIWVIILIIVIVQAVIYGIQPDMVIEGWTHDSLRLVTQSGVALIFCGIWLMNKITRFKL